MSMFARRFLFDPGEDVLLEIESVNILDLEPPASISGIGAGHATLVGEFENGDFNVPTEVFSATELMSEFGSLGYERNAVTGNDPCARSRKADAAIVAELWNGNGFIQLSGKKFKRLSLVRVDTSVGYVELKRLAYLTGLAAFAYKLTSGQTVVVKIDGGGALTTTFTGVAAIMLAVGGVYPTTFAGGETITFEVDDGTQFTVTFLDADESNAQVVSRINLFAGFTIADLSGGQLRLTGRKLGTGGYVKVVAASAAGVLTQLGLPVVGTSVAGTGNVGDIKAVSLAEARTAIRLATTNGVEVEADSLGRIRMSNTTTPLTGTLEVTTGTTADAFGWTEGTVATAVTGTLGTIPAGTVVQNTGATAKFVTMLTVNVTAESAGPYQVKVRHATDDTTGTSALAGTISVVASVPDLGAFSCLNPNLLTACLTEDQIDAAYVTTIATTLDPSSVCKETNIIWSARQSNSIRNALKQNALDASADGLQGRMACVRTPLNTLKATAKSTVAAPGVGATRDQRVVYCYPQARTYVPLIARRGTAGGVGFTADGIIDVGADGFLASVMSQLPPEENPAQQNAFMTGIVALESGANIKGFTKADYTAFKKAGICALIMDGGEACFQSGVTSVDPVTHGSIKNINRRRMADYIQDTLIVICKPYGKKLQTLGRRKALLGDINAWMRGLRSADNPERQRIDSYSVSDKGNTVAALAKGLYRITVKAKTLSTFDSIAVASTVGETVVVEELPAAA